MRPDLANCTISKLNLIGLQRIQYPNGAVTEEADYRGFRAEDPSGHIRCFLQLAPGDLSHDWVEITDKIESFTVWVTGADTVEEE